MSGLNTRTRKRVRRRARADAGTLTVPRERPGAEVDEEDEAGGVFEEADAEGGEHEQTSRDGVHGHRRRRRVKKRRASSRSSLSKSAASVPLGAPASRRLSHAGGAHPTAPLNQLLRAQPTIELRHWPSSGVDSDGQRRYFAQSTVRRDSCAYYLV